MDAHIIIGRASVGKSSSVRILTGIRNNGRRLMARPAGADFQLWAKDSSLQEAGITPQEFIATVTEQNVDAVLLTLWPQGRRSKGVQYPDAAGYIDDFIAAGWKIRPVVLLSSSGSTLTVSLPAGTRSAHFVNDHAVPFNTFAGTLRAYWGWR